MLNWKKERMMITRSTKHGMALFVGLYFPLGVFQMLHLDTSLLFCILMVSCLLT